MSTQLERGTARWLHMEFISAEHTAEIQEWIDETGLDIQPYGVIVDPRTFEPVQKWYVETEEDKTIFLLKWSNTQ